jgi:hypothetical protein
MRIGYEWVHSFVDELSRLPYSELQPASCFKGGSICGAVARAFAREGARVFLAGRTAAKLDAVADQIRSAGGAVERLRSSTHSTSARSTSTSKRWPPKRAGLTSPST